MSTLGKNRYIKNYYETPDIYLRYLDSKAPVDGYLTNNYLSSNRKCAADWCDTYDFAEAMDLGRKGDFKTAEKIKPTDLYLHNKNALNAVIYDYAGDNVDIGRFVSGEPECMMSLRKKGKPIITLLVNVSVDCGVEAEKIIERGRAVLDIVSGLEANGYAVDITIIDSMYDNTHRNYWNKIKIKDCKEYMNLPQLAFWLVSPSVLRRLGFRHSELYPDDIQGDIGEGYGRPRDLEKQELDLEKDTIYFPKLDSWGRGIDFSKNIKQALEQYGIES